MTERFFLVVKGLAWCAVVGGSPTGFVFFGRYLRERQMLKTLLRGLLKHDRVQSREDLVALKRFLTQKISYDLSKRDDPRPLLRQPAAATLASGKGFCGENARVAIRLLSLGGIRANRLYLRGPRWSHVLVEHRWENGWRLFDGHADPGTFLPDADVGRIASDKVEELPNRYRDVNPWIDSFRLRLPVRPAFLRALRQSRPPRWVVAVAESPDLLRALVGGAALVSGVVLLGSLP